MRADPELQQSKQPQKPEAIRYKLTRWDLVVGWRMICLRNRHLQVLAGIVFILNGLVAVGPGFNSRPLWVNLIILAGSVIVFVVLIVAFQLILALANAYLKEHRGDLGEHQLEIRDDGLFESTEYNESLHRWASVRRIIDSGKYLSIYVSDSKFYLIPKRFITKGEIESFVAHLKAMAPEARAS